MLKHRKREGHTRTHRGAHSTLTKAYARHAVLHGRPVVSGMASRAPRASAAPQSARPAAAAAWAQCQNSEIAHLIKVSIYRRAVLS